MSLAVSFYFLVKFSSSFVVFIVKFQKQQARVGPSVTTPRPICPGTKPVQIRLRGFHSRPSRSTPSVLRLILLLDVKKPNHKHSVRNSAFVFYVTAINTDIYALFLIASSLSNIIVVAPVFSFTYPADSAPMRSH